jgi:glyoxylase-like metal-dependent hydrolase (beta-lactamase superfamily II)
VGFAFLECFHVIRVLDHGPIRQFRMARNLWGKGVYWTAAYLVDGLLIDTGCAYTAGELTEALKHQTVRQIVNTHSHEDHIGANGVLARERGIPILAHPLALPVLAAPRSSLALRWYQRALWGRPEPSLGRPIPDEIATPNHVFQVIPTPGHSPDHMALFEPQKGWLFSGDIFVGGRDRTLRSDYRIGQIIDSLKRLLILGPKLLFTASGSIRSNPEADLAEKIRYLEETGGRVRELAQAGMNIKDIRNRLFGREMAMRYYTGGHFSGLNLVRSFLADPPTP